MDGVRRHFRFVQRKTVWVPTWLGWLTVLVVGFGTLSFWMFCGEAVLSATHREGAEILVVEGWIGMPGVRAAKAEFDSGGYKYIVTAGGMTNNRWGSQRWNYATLTRDYLVRLGVPADRVLPAPARDTNKQRTWESAMGVKAALAPLSKEHHMVNVFTLGSHARRSRLVFEKVLGATASVGVIGWLPSSESSRRWWNSSERALDFLKESVAYPLELFFSSGRRGGAAESEPASGE